MFIVITLWIFHFLLFIYIYLIVAIITKKILYRKMFVSSQLCNPNNVFNDYLGFCSYYYFLNKYFFTDEKYFRINYVYFNLSKSLKYKLIHHLF